LWIYDYLIFSQNERCWPDENREQVKSGIKDIQKLKKYTDKVGAELFVYLIPSGWAFPNENLIGKSAPGYFNLSKDAVVSQKGLALYMEHELRNIGVSFTDLEPVIKKLKGNSSEKWYFPVDGHWNESAHRALSKFLIKELHLKK
jgi:hypothetical protein